MRRLQDLHVYGILLVTISAVSSVTWLGIEMVDFLHIEWGAMNERHSLDPSLVNCLGCLRKFFVL